MINIKFKIKYTKIKRTNKVIICYLLILFAAQICSCDSRFENQNEKNLTLKERLDIEKNIFHWLPYKRIYYTKLHDGTLQEQQCPERNPAINEFPPGIWTQQQRLRGLFLIHVFAAVYFFIVLAFICDKYFLPSVERICDELHISPDVAATTFMATATTTPEFFSNTISTFIAENDMGLSAIVGSMLFNTLGVAACASLFAKKPIQIDWWPITRDAILFSINVLILVSIAWDGAVMWWETCILLTVYVLYWTFMFQNDRIMRNIKYLVEEKLMWCQRIKNYDIVNQRSLNDSLNSNIQSDKNAIQKPGVYNFGFQASTSDFHQLSKDIEIRDHDSQIDITKRRRQSTDLTQIYAEEDEGEFQIWIIPKNVTKFDIFWYFFTWPIRFFLHYTIPNPIKHKRLFPLTFIMCIIWIACTSYMVFWMIVIFGDTFRIPDSVIGLTFLAFGGCMPEAISAVIIARKGSGQMGVSNALGANSLAVLFSLGFPWFISTMKNGAGWTGAYIRIYSYGIEYTIIAIIFAVLVLYLIIAAAGYKLQKLVGVFLGLAYLFFACFAILVELEILFEPTERC